MSTIKKPSGVRGQPPGHRRSTRMLELRSRCMQEDCPRATRLSNTADFCTKDERNTKGLP